MNPLFRRLPALVFAFLMLAPSAARAAQPWIPFSSPADGFTASFPGQPDQQSKDLDTQYGKIPVHSFAAQDGKTAIVLGVLDYTHAAKATRDADAFLDAGKQGVLMAAGATLIAESKTTLGGNPGVEFSAQADESVLFVRIYWVNGYVYQLMTITAGKGSDSLARRFLDSFQFLPRSAK